MLYVCSNNNFIYLGFAEAKALRSCNHIVKHVVKARSWSFKNSNHNES